MATTAKANKDKGKAAGVVAKNAPTEEKKVRGAIQSLPEKIAWIFWEIFQLVIQLGVTMMELVDAFAGEAGKANCERMAAHFRDVVRGVGCDVAGLPLDLAQKLGIVEEATDITPPTGGKVFRVLIPVYWVTPWRDYQLACCPQTPKERSILDVGDQYESPHRTVTAEEALIVWFGLNIRRTAEEADRWFEVSSLERAHGRIPAAVIGSVPNLPEQLRKFGYPYPSAGVVSTSSCLQDAARCIPSAWRSADGGRGANLDGAGRGWYGGNLFAASRPSRK